MALTFRLLQAEPDIVLGEVGIDLFLLDGELTMERLLGDLDGGKRGSRAIRLNKDILVEALLLAAFRPTNGCGLGSEISLGQTLVAADDVHLIDHGHRAVDGDIRFVFTTAADGQDDSYGQPNGLLRIHHEKFPQSQPAEGISPYERSQFG